MNKILVGKGNQESYLNLKMLNRHGIIAGATGTGKTITLKVIAENLSEQGIPVFVSDVKGDISSIMNPIEYTENIKERVEKTGISDFEPKGYPIELLDVFGEEGAPIRTTMSSMGPLILSRLLGLNEIQYGVLNIAFKLADDEGLLLIDIKDLRAILNLIMDNASALIKNYGNISKQTVGAILRSLLTLEQQGGNFFFGEPDFDVMDFFRKNNNNEGYINILSSKKLMNSPILYSTFLFWMLSELYENLPEVGDLDKPKIVFFFDEAHFLFRNSSPVVIEKIELIVRLIRSKGVGVFFVTQNPVDIPNIILSQLGNKIQHGLRAYSPKELKSLRLIAETYRNDENLNVEELIANLGVGEAVVSFLDEKGIPINVDKITVCPPRSKIGVISPEDMNYSINNSSINHKYMEAVDNYSAYEELEERNQEQIKLNQNEKTEKAEKASGGSGILGELLGGSSGSSSSRSSGSSSNKKSNRMTTSESFTRSILTSIGREIGRQVTRGVFGTRKK